jgi:hypothetical protein
MLQNGSGSSAAAGLLGGESGPPVGPATIGRPPSHYEAPPVPLRPFPTSLLSTTTESKREDEPTSDVPENGVPAVAEVRRLVVRLLGGDEVELGTFDDRGDAMEAAEQLVAQFSAAEAAGEWPEVDGRFLRPGAVASIDVLVTD